MSEAGSTGKPEAKPEDTQAQLEKLNKQLADLRAQKDKEDADKKHTHSVLVKWLIGIVIAILVIVGIVAGVNDVNYHKEQYNKAVDETACSVYGTEQEQKDCEKVGPDEYGKEQDSITAY